MQSFQLFNEVSYQRSYHANHALTRAKLQATPPSLLPDCDQQTSQQSSQIGKNKTDDHVSESYKWTSCTFFTHSKYTPFVAKR